MKQQSQQRIQQRQLPNAPPNNQQPPNNMQQPPPRQQPPHPSQQQPQSNNQLEPPPGLMRPRQCPLSAPLIRVPVRDNDSGGIQHKWVYHDQNENKYYLPIQQQNGPARMHQQPMNQQPPYQTQQVHNSNQPPPQPPYNHPSSSSPQVPLNTNNTVPNNYRNPSPNPYDRQQHQQQNNPNFNQYRNGFARKIDITGCNSGSLGTYVVL